MNTETALVLHSSDPAVGTAGAVFVTLWLLPTFVMLGTYLGMNRSLTNLAAESRFDQDQMTEVLKKVVQNRLGNVGLVYTLSDKNYKPNIFLEALGKIAGNVLILFGPFIRPSFQIVNVKNERSFFILAYFLVTRWKGSLRSLISGGQAFNIRTTDAWWKRCIDLLMNSCDVVVMDTARLSTGSKAWEMDRLNLTQSGPADNFHCPREYADEAHRSLQKILGASAAERLFVFNSEGQFTDDTAFQKTFDNEWKSALKQHQT